MCRLHQWLKISPRPRGWEIVEFKDLLKDDEGSKASEKHLKDVIAADPDNFPNFDALVAFSAKEIDHAYILLFNNGCMFDNHNMPKEAFNSLKMFSEGT